MPSYTRAALLSLAVVSSAFLSARPAVHAADVAVEAGRSDALRALLAGAAPAGVVADEQDERRWKSVQEFYWNRGYAPAWVRDDRLTPGGAALLRVLTTAGSEGLPAERYDPALIAGHGPQVIAAAATTDTAGDRLARLDAALTYGFLRYAIDLGEGSVDPRGSSILWRATPRTIDAVALLGDAVTRDAPADVLASLRPAHPQYLALTEALATYRRIASAGGWAPLPDGVVLKPGKKSPHVPALRLRLQASGDLAGVGVGNVYDKALVEAVKRFQRRHGLAADGIVAGETLLALNVPVEDRIRQIELNLERWRWQGWTPAGRSILVNVPTYELHAYEDGREALAMRVITGKDDSPTPVFGETMTHVVFRPYWNVPTNILLDEVMPAIAKDRGYLARNDMEMVRGEGGVSVRQRPGPRNSLGLVKFLFPNPYHVYLHDTPGDALFARDRRALSHGCVRLEKPEELARFVLRGTEWDDAAIARAMRAGDERFVTLADGIPVTIAYFTAWVDADGTVRFGPDVYRHDVAQQKLLPVPKPPTMVASARS